MKRSKPLQRKTPLRRKYDEAKIKASRENKALQQKENARAVETNDVQRKLRSPIARRSPKRRAEETAYGKARIQFLKDHPRCPVTGLRTTQIHHSAKRTGKWLNLQRYWIAVSAKGHEIIESNKKWAEDVGLMVRIREDYEYHRKWLLTFQTNNLDRPVFYDIWDGQLLKPYE